MIKWNKLKGEVISVISDIHSNKRALEAALKLVDAKRTDKLIILGDILTYGINAQETLDMLQKRIDKGALIFKGNHDDIYLKLINNQPSFFNDLRDDIQESILYNIKRIDCAQYKSWDWKMGLIHNEVFFSHANPYGNLWTYINSEEDHKNAAYQIDVSKCIAGVFGHTHRSKCYSFKEGFLDYIQNKSKDTFILNSGSVGQARSKDARSTFLRLCSHKGKLWAEIENIKYDMQSHREEIINSSLSGKTKKMLLPYFVSDNGYVNIQGRGI